MTRSMKCVDWEVARRQKLTATQSSLGKFSLHGLKVLNGPHLLGGDFSKCTRDKIPARFPIGSRLKVRSKSPVAPRRKVLPAARNALGGAVVQTPQRHR